MRMSPNMFSVTMTSKVDGRRMRCMAQASTSRFSKAMSGNSVATRTAVSRQRRLLSRTFALSTEVTCLRRPAASRKAARTTRSISATE